MAGEKKAKKAAPEEKRESKRESKKAQKAESNIFSKFSQRQIAEFKEGFSVMDRDKDGILSKADLKATWETLGRIVGEAELDQLVGEASGPLNFTQLLTLFANRMSGGSVDDEVIVAAFKSFDEGGSIDPEKLRVALTTFGDKFTNQEVDDAYGQMSIENGKIDTAKLISLLTASAEEDEKK
jgi:Ca2+-binding EF-hand superfamily protein